jgi:hypothetical protein
MNRIDFDLIVNELSKGLRDHNDPLVQACGWFNVITGVDGKTALSDFRIGADWYYREFRTVGFWTPRQTGKTHWIASKTMYDEQALVITRDESLRSQFENYTHGEPEHVRESTRQRVITISEAKARIKAGKLKEYRTYFIDEASHSFHFLSRQFHQHLLDTNQFDPKIILVG